MDQCERGKTLHDRATRGMPLSAAEQAELETWYEGEDQLEGAVLGQPDAAERLGALQGQLDTALAQLTAAGERVRELAAQNDALRRETDVLKHRLETSPSRRAG